MVVTTEDTVVEDRAPVADGAKNKVFRLFRSLFSRTYGESYGKSAEVQSLFSSRRTFLGHEKSASNHGVVKLQDLLWKF